MYKIVFGRSAEKEMEHLPGQIIKRVSKVIDALALEARPHNSKKLKGSI